jgi:primosomal protein N' (replication factor Y)
MKSNPRCAPQAAPVGMLLEIAVALPVPDLYTYRDQPRAERLPLGAQVVVPFGGRQATGFVVGHPEALPRDVPGGVREILSVVGDGPALDAAMLELCRWAASYYLAPLGEVLRAAIPVGERAAATRRLRLTEKGSSALGAGRTASLAALTLDPDDRALLERIKKASSLSAAGLARGANGEATRAKYLLARGFLEVADRVRGLRRRQNAWDEVAKQKFQGGEAPPILNDHQAEAFTALRAALGNGYATYLLQGVTGSGKTEVYLRTIAEVRQRGGGALVLVPEIALTPQLAARFRARFGDDVAVLHSAVSPGERAAAWRRLRRGEVGIALGARSAVFAPVVNLAVVVVDEEHDGSFKQEEGFRYHARDLAVMRANQAGALAILGSATPSLESYSNVLRGRFRRVLLPVRANPAAARRPLPVVEIIDLRRHPAPAGGLLSPPLAAALTTTLDAGEQAILFLNRRGFAPMVHCRACGHVLGCSACAVSLTLHQGRGHLRCHYCGHAEPVRQHCPQCKSANLQALGSGTERVEAQVRQTFPHARVARLDRDTADARRGNVEDVLARVNRREVDILIGTQMVTKGHDFGGVTLVGILQPDQGIHLPDFRAAERAFQLMEQVAGRAGRGDRPGRVLVQTYGPQHPAIQCLVTHDYEGFVRDELARREIAQYPPYTRMVVLRLEGKAEREVNQAADHVARAARAVADPTVRILGPSAAPIPRLRGRTRLQIWLSGTDRGKLLTVSRTTQRMSLPRDVRLEVDVDPQSVL